MAIFNSKLLNYWRVAACGRWARLRLPAWMTSRPQDTVQVIWELKHMCIYIYCIVLYYTMLYYIILYYIIYFDIYIYVHIMSYKDTSTVYLKLKYTVYIYIVAIHLVYIYIYPDIEYSACFPAFSEEFLDRCHEAPAAVQLVPGNLVAVGIPKWNCYKAWFQIEPFSYIHYMEGS